MALHKIQVFRIFERVWHWSQALLIFTLLFTGFAIRDLHRLIDFQTAVNLHTLAALLLLAIWIFATFWLFTTGQWRHFLPTRKNFVPVARFYIHGIFKGEHHPYTKTYRRKHNPLQALTYLLLKTVIFPAIWISGLLYLAISLGLFDTIPAPGVGLLADIHTIAAFAVLVFIILHVYLLTTGGSFVDHVRPMITGYDEADLTDEEYAYLKQDEPGKIQD